jgi:hypothetical protein
MAVCRAIDSRRYRTPRVARGVCAGVWVASLVVMLPVYLYVRTVDVAGRTSCTIDWPEGQFISADQAFIWYAFALGFAGPVALISIFYWLVVIRLRSVGPNQAQNPTQVPTVRVVFAGCMHRGNYAS